MINVKDIKIKPVSIEDLDEIFNLEQVCFENDSFSKEQFRYLIQKANREFVAIRCNKKIIAYLILLKRKNSKKYRIYSIAISPEYRGFGIAKKLLNYAEEVSKKNHIYIISLEVNENNSAAISLYKNQGFKITSKRFNYYTDGSSALIAIKNFENNL